MTKNIGAPHRIESTQSGWTPNWLRASSVLSPSRMSRFRERRIASTTSSPKSLIEVSRVTSDRAVVHHLPWDEDAAATIEGVEKALGGRLHGRH